jgi:hypothetical protein
MLTLSLIRKSSLRELLPFYRTSLRDNSKITRLLNYLPAEYYPLASLKDLQ